MNEVNLVHTMQIHLESGKSVFVTVESFDDYQTRKEFIERSKKEFVEVMDTCSVKKSRIELVEYYNYDPSKEPKKKGGKNKWPKK